MIEREEVVDRLQAGHRGLQISSNTRRDHIDAMAEALGSAEEVNDPPRIARRMVPLALRNAAILLAAFCLGVAGAANSERVPGDAFYNAKLAAETPAQIVDRDIVANNRLGELAVLIERGADPEIVLTARTDAVRALLDRQSDDPMFQALNLLAWPGELAGRGIDIAPSSEGLLITEAEWAADGGYTASLADGHLVRIFSVDGDVLIGTTGNWTVFTTASGWQLLNDDVNQVYTLNREGTAFRVSTVVAAADPSEGEEEVADGPNQTFQGTSLIADDERAVGDNDGVGQDRPSATAPPSDRATTVTAERTETDLAPTTTLPGTPTTADVAGSTPQTVPPVTTSTTTTVTAPETTKGGTPEGETTSQTTPPTSAPTTTSAPATTTTSTATTSTTVQPTTTTTAPPQPTVWDFYLQNPGSGNTSSSATLPLSTGGAPTGSLANFDTDRDSDPGLMIKKDGAGLSGSDRTKVQEWVWTASSTSFDGEGRLTIWLAAKDFKSDERIGFLAAVDVCDPGCTRLGTGQWSGSGSSSFRQATVSFGSIDRPVPAGATLRLKVVVPDGLATTDVWFAFDAGAYPSRLTIG